MSGKEKVPQTQTNKVNSKKLRLKNFLKYVVHPHFETKLYYLCLILYTPHQHIFGIFDKNVIRLKM